MKVLIDPDWAYLAQDLSTEEKAELLMCILDYPNQECKSGLWRFIKKQLDKDAKKYKEKCARMRENGRNRWLEKSDTISDTSSNTTSDTKSQANTDSSSDSITSTKKEKDKKEKENALAFNVAINQFSREHRFESQSEFEITYDFSFTKIMQRNRLYIPSFSPYPLEVLEKAEKSLIKKRYGQKLRLNQLISWLNQSNEFYKQDTESKNES